MRTLGLALIVWTIGFSCLAELKIPAVFSDGMVLQRDQVVPVWGWADPGAKVTVSFAGQEKEAKAGENGRFMVRFDKMKASATPRSLKIISGDDFKEIKHVLVGEVWLCSGQSNMLMEVKKSSYFEKEKSEANYPEIRMFLTDLKANIEPQEDCTGSWMVCSPDTVGAFSATAYFFGREIHKELGVPIGLIRSSWGGTRIEAWSPKASLEQFPSVMKSKAKSDKVAKTFNQEKVNLQFAEKMEEWKVSVEEAKANGEKKPRKPRKKIHPHKNKNYSSNLYNAMINPLVPYGIKGAIWYQGESNTRSIKEAIIYRDLLENMLTQWRQDWNDTFPFYAVQLVNYKKPQVAPVEDTSWAFIRESFLKFHKEVPNAGMIVAIDVGDEKDIHPKNKQAVGYRLAQQVLAKTYGKKIVPGGPIYTSMKKEGNKIIVSFENIGSGLVEQDGEPLKRFAIAGDDQQFVEALAVIAGDNTVIVSSEKIPDPVAVRYAWANNPSGCNLFNKEGFPASPFRTDDWAPTEK